MDDRIYQDPFDLDFPDIVEEVQLEEGPINAIKKKVADAGANRDQKAKIRDWVKQSFYLQREYFGAHTPADIKQFSEGLAIYWDRYVIAYCKDPFVKKPELSFEEFSTFEAAMERARNVATILGTGRAVKKIPDYLLLKEKGEGGRIPLFVCVDRSKLKDSLSKSAEDLDDAEAELRMAFGNISHKLNTICPSASNIGCITSFDGKEGLKNLTCLVYFAIGDNFGNSTIQETSPENLANFDVEKLLKKRQNSEATSIEVEDNSEASAKPAEEPKTDRFETEEFKSELKEIGFTDAQIEVLYKSGAFKALAAINLDDIEEGE